ncbi:cache domain-containing protein [candidate division WOR-3 bacterium]|nr:cache domain-containing protein [candidate division WOR-3 bacterium]MCK4527186.1 cache domain-containing protein [candidate division WOR-3 bacterium]
MKISLRLKLLFYFISVIILTGIVSTTVGVHLIGDRIVKQAQNKVELDLNSAREIYKDKIKEVRTSIRLTALRFFLKDAILKNNIGNLETEIRKIRKRESLDILVLTDSNGKVIFRARNPAVYGDYQVDDELIGRVIYMKEIVASTVIITRDELVKEGEDLALQVRMKLISTPKAKPRPGKEETSGMMIKAAAPVLDKKGNLIGVLYGGNLLNRNYEIVDKIKDIVYRGETYKEKDIGTATIFQGDLRISTNVKTVGGTRAIGTRVSKEVNNKVLIKGEPWIGRAFVVNNWYITAYEPIRNIKNKVIGILYVGILEEKFVDMRRRTLLTFLMITFAGILVAFAISNILSNSITRPIRSLVSASDKLAKGYLSHRVECRTGDAIGELARAFNCMADSIKERDEQLKEYVKQEIMKSERLAMIGQLAAGVAHEINNPLGSILIYSHLLLEDLEENDPRGENLKKIVNQATRCKVIVKGLLDFAHQSEPEMKPSDVNRIVNEVLSLVERQAVFHNIKIIKKLSINLPFVMVDETQIQQVFMNIVLNAAEAMEGQGELIIETSSDGKFINAKFTDTGCGIPEQNIKKLFEPFFSTKTKGHGIGLGLAISYGIIKKHNGRINIDSEVGKGSTFTIQLPIQRKDD